jgi:hypothetical protein
MELIGSIGSCPQQVGTGQRVEYETGKNRRRLFLRGTESAQHIIRALNRATPIVPSNSKSAPSPTSTTSAPHGWTSRRIEVSSRTTGEEGYPTPIVRCQ